MGRESRYVVAFWPLLGVIAFCFFPVWVQSAQAESFREQLEYGNALLNSGDFEGAREVYRGLQIEHPEDEVVYYSLGCADYEEGESVIALKDHKGAIELFSSARDSFRHAVTSREKWLRVDAAYNHANSVAQIAKQTAFLGNQEATVAAFEEAVNAYEGVLERYPEHEEARHNLDHIRYLLKRMLQQPPPEQQQQQDQEQNQGEQQQNQEQQPGEQQQQEESESQQPQNQQQREEREEEQPQQQPQETAASEDTEPQADAEEQEEQPDRQTIEAILQTLEAQDKREQQDLRTSMPDSQIRREWW
jgi:hypothetical protein